MANGAFLPVILRLFYADEHNQEFLVSLLKSMLRLPEDDYNEIEIADPHLLREFEDDKLAVIDVKLHTQSKNVMHTFFVAITALLIFNSSTICAQSNIIESSNGSDNIKGTIIGKVFKLRDLPASGATVQLYDPEIRKIQLSVNTDQYGKFVFNDVTPGDYIINISSGSGFCDHPVAVSVKEGTNEIEEQILTTPRTFSPNPELEAIFNKSVSGYKIITVCEWLSLKSINSLHFLDTIIIMGNLIQTPEGSWLEQSCGNPVKSGIHSWPDAIFLNKDSSPSNSSTFILEEASKRFGKDFIQNNSSSNGVAVAVSGKLIAGDDLVYVKCGEEKTCGFGYGPIAAPVQINYKLIRYMNQNNHGKE